MNRPFRTTYGGLFVLTGISTHSYDPSRAMKSSERATSRLTLTIDGTPASRDIAADIVSLVAASCGLEERRTKRLVRTFGLGLRLIRGMRRQKAGKDATICRIEAGSGRVDILILDPAGPSGRPRTAPGRESLSRLEGSRWRSGPRDRGLLIEGRS